MAKFKAVIFDKDGTLVDGKDPETGDAIDVHRECWKQAFANLGVEFDSELHRTQIRGHVLSEIDSSLRKLFDLEEGVSLSGEKSRIYLEEGISKYIQFIPGVETTLEKLKESGYLLGLLTNARRVEAEAVARKLGLERFMGTRIRSSTDAEEDGQKGKPDPYGLNKMIDDLNLDKSEVVFVGDTTIDMKTAAAAGVFSIGFSHVVSAEDLKAAGANEIITEFEAISDIIKG